MREISGRLVPRSFINVLLQPRHLNNLCLEECMCFRPSSADLSVICPSCGKKVSSLGGIKQTACLFCKADLTNADPASTTETNLNIPKAQPPNVPRAPEASVPAESPDA